MRKLEEFSESELIELRRSHEESWHDHADVLWPHVAKEERNYRPATDEEMVGIQNQIDRNKADRDSFIQNKKGG